uniref:TIMELESS domain-containing protein n=1 Tax=Steinernema glaseri TaxID=37863 RepID=A0A1I7ZZT5_9BILA
MEPVVVLVNATIGALGFRDKKGKYHREPDCYESIRDVITYLQNDHEMKDRLDCLDVNVIKHDLVPIMSDPDTPDNIFDVALRLAVNLCQPISLVYMSLLGEMPKSKEEWKLFVQLNEKLTKAKLGFASQELMTVLCKKIEAFFSLGWEDRSETKKMLTKRIMLLLKYALAINNAESDERRTPEDINTHNRVVVAFLNAGLGDVLTKIGANRRERDFHLYVMEIFALLLKEHKPSDIYLVGTVQQKEVEQQLLQKVVNEEREKMLSKRRQLPSRHSAFAGTFVVQGCKALNRKNDTVIQRAVPDPKFAITYMIDNKERRKLYRKDWAIETNRATHLSSEEVRSKLKNLYETFLPAAFVNLLKNSRDAAFGGKTFSHGISSMYYFIAMRLGLEYVRLAKMPFSYVSEIVSTTVFHHTQTALDEFLDQMSVNKAEAIGFAMKAQCAVAAFKELVMCLNHYIVNSTGETLEMCKDLANEILKLEEYRDTGFAILKRFAPNKMSKQVLRDMIVCIHYYIRIMERSYKEGALRVVSKRQKVARRRAKNKDVIQKENPFAVAVDSMPIGVLLTHWDDEVAMELSDLLNGYAAPDLNVVVIDSLLKVSAEQEMSFAMLLIQRQLRDGNVSKAVGLYRGARELWPDGMFGTDDMTPEQEFNELHEIYFTDLVEISKEYNLEQEKVYGSEDILPCTEASSSDEEKEELNQDTTKEIEFKFDEYVLRFARPETLRWIALLFAEYDRNPEDVNKCVLKLMHRIAFDFSQPSRLYHVSIFQTLLKIKNELKGLHSSKVKTHKHYHLYEFGFYLLRKFFRCLTERGPKLIPEMLFWKNSSETFDIENGYGAFENEKKNKAVLWSEELEDEVEKLHEEFMAIEEKPEGMDVADFIEHNLSQTRNRKQILKKLKKMNLDMGDLRIKPKKSKTKKRKAAVEEVDPEELRKRLDAIPDLPEDHVGRPHALSPELEMDMSGFSGDSSDEFSDASDTAPNPKRKKIVCSDDEDE